MYMANPCGSSEVLDAMRSGLLGYIDTPLQGNARPEGVAWCADNGAFSARFDETAWWRWLTAQHSADCLFAVAPDVVGDATATEARSLPWLDRIRERGFPVAYVAQDGLEERHVPWDLVDVLFIGGTTAWKLGFAARCLVVEAKLHGKRVHMGRVNSHRRFEYARAIGCDSVDGTFLTYGPRRLLPELLGWLRSVDQPPLFGGLT